LNSDDRFEQAVRIKHANQRIIELAQNWCSHLAVERYGGTGMIEIETGLPIGMRRFKCPHASAVGMAGMDLGHVVLDFYDRNCVDCDKRSPVRLPNLSQLVIDRDRSREAADAAERRNAELERIAIGSRAARRVELSKNSDPATVDIFDTINRLDEDPNKQHHDILTQTAVAAAEHFDSNVKEALFDLAEAGGIRTDAALETLSTVGADPARLCESALRALSRREAYRVAGRIVARHLSKVHDGLVEAALPALVSLAMDVSGFMPTDSVPGDPDPLLMAYRLFPEPVERLIRILLRVDSKHPRIEACNGISIIARVDHEFGPKVLTELIDSLELTDDGFGEYGSAESWVQSVLAELMLSHEQLIDDAIQQRMTVASDDTQAALFGVYERILRGNHSENSSDQARATSLARELPYRRFVEMLLHRPSSAQLTKVIWFLRDYAGLYPDLLERHAESMLGAAALIASDLNVPQSSSLDITPDPLKAIEEHSRRFGLNQALDSVFDVLAAAAARNQNTVGASIMRTFETLNDKHDRLKAGLVRCLGAMAADAAVLADVLPLLYQAMTSQATRVRGAAAEAYAALAERDPDGLPSLVHESFMLLLLDPFVFVQAQALESLRKVSLPAPYLPRAKRSLLALISAHAGSKSTERVSRAAVEAFIELYVGTEEIPEKLRQFLLSAVERMDATNAAQVLTHWRGILHGTSRLTSTLARLLGDLSLSEYDVEGLIRALADAPAAELAVVADDLRAAAKTCDLRQIEIMYDLMEILSAAGCWKTAAEIAGDSTDRLSDTLWDRPKRLRCASFQVAAEIETAAASGDPEKVQLLSHRWLQLDLEIKQNDEAYKGKRDPLLGLPFPD
jgi:hypothetical protein